jgi:asparagine synthase (glutamine-hydrolysing)
MSSIFGIMRGAGTPVPPHEIDLVAARLDYWHADARSAWRGNGVALGSLLLRTSSEAANDALVDRDEEYDLTIASDLRIDNREELATALGVRAADAAAWPDSRLVLRAYREWGEECVPRLLGDFAFAIWDGRRRQLLCARDPFGIKPFYYFDGTSPRAFAFASEIKGLLALDFVDRSIDEQWICDYLLGLMVGRDSTMYAKIRRLEPAHLLVVGDAGTRKRRYWSANVTEEIRLRDDGEYVEAFLERLQIAVRRCIGTSGDVGAELSGGLDSSGICAVAHPLLKASGRELHTFSQVLAPSQRDAHLQTDGRPAIEQVCGHLGIERTNYLTGEREGSIAALDWVTRYCDEPPRFLLGLWNDLTYSAVSAANLRVLLSGFGGNEGVTSTGVQRREELFTSGQWRELWRDMKGSTSSAIPLRPIAGLVVRNIMPSWWRRRQPAARSFFQKLPYRPLRDQLAEKWRTHERAIEFLRAYEIRGSMREAIARPLDAPGVSIRLEFSHLATTARRIEYRYPLLDRELIAFYLATPSHLKQRNGVGRYLFRRSMQGLLPDAVQWSSPRAAATPNSPERKRRDAAELQARLDAVPADSQVFHYADREKLSASFDVKMPAGLWRWSREGDLIKVLILDQKLRDAGAMRPFT